MLCAPSTSLVYEGQSSGGADLLSYDILIMTCIDFEGAILSPQVDRDRYAGDSPLVHEFSCFSASDCEFAIGILFPETEEERIFGEETVVDVTGCADELRTGIASHTAFESFSGCDELLPSLEIVRVLKL